MMHSFVIEALLSSTVPVAGSIQKPSRSLRSRETARAIQADLFVDSLDAIIRSARVNSSFGIVKAIRREEDRE